MTPAGVTFLDHTADVGMDVEAASLEELLHRAALGMLALLRGEDDEQRGGAGSGGSSAADPHPSGPGLELDLSAGSGAELLRAWLRELLLLHEVDHRDYVAFTPGVLEPWVLRCVVWTRAGGHAVREIKGVTYHGLEVREQGGRWQARVIFDV